MVAKADLSPTARHLLKRVKQRYLKSRDFNGLHFRRDQPTDEEIEAAVELVEAGLVRFASQMGNWPDGIGPFERLTLELKNISELFENVWGAELLRTHETPDDFGWILRADQREWDHFIHSLDKLLSDNINGSALDKAGVAKMNAAGQPIGTLVRLELFMTMNRVEPEKAKWAVAPLREVRAARQKPAHSLRTNVTDKTFVRKQMYLMHDVDEVLINIRQWLASHPRNHAWTDPSSGLKDYPI